MTIECEDGFEKDSYKSCRYLEAQRQATNGAETAAQEAWRSASTTAAALEEQAALTRSLQKQLVELEARHENQVS